MHAWRRWSLLAFFVAGCASAAPADRPGDAGVDPGGGNPIDGFASGPGPTTLDLASAQDLGHAPAGLTTGGTWTSIGSPADALGTALDSQMPSITTWNDAPALAWVEGQDTRVATFGTGWTLRGAALNPNPGARTVTPQIAARDDQLSVAFLQPPPTANVNSAYVYAWTGSAWSAVGAAVPLQLSFLGDLSLALGSTGKPVIAWTQQVNGALSGPSNVYVQRFDGTSWQAYGAGFAAESATSSALAAQVRVDDADHVYVTWQEQFVHVYTDAGSWSAVGLGKLSAGSASGSFEQQLALDSKARPLVAWMEYDGTASGVYVARYDAGAWQTLTSTALSATPGATNSQLSNLTVDGLDVPLVSWVENDAMGLETAYVVRLGGGAPSFVGQPLHLPTGFRYLGPPQLSVDSLGDATMVFTGQQISDSKSRLFVYRYVSP